MNIFNNTLSGNYRYNRIPHVDFLVVDVYSQTLASKIRSMALTLHFKNILCYLSENVPEIYSNFFMSKWQTELYNTPTPKLTEMRASSPLFFWTMTIGIQAVTY